MKIQDNKNVNTSEVRYTYQNLLYRWGPKDYPDLPYRGVLLPSKPTYRHFVISMRVITALYNDKIN